MFIYDIKRETAVEWFNIDNHLINSSETSFVKPLCTTELKSATPTASFVIKYRGDIALYRETIDYILEAIKEHEKIHAKISENGVILASGYIDASSISIISSSMPESLTLDIRDYIVDLDKKITSVNFVQDKADNSSGLGISVYSAVKKILEFAGYTGELLQNDLGYMAIDHFCVTEDDDCTYREKIDKILFELIDSSFLLL